MKEYTSDINAEGYFIGIVVSSSNEPVSKKFLEGALKCLKKYHAQEEEISVIWVPSPSEMPFFVNQMVVSSKFDLILCLGTLSEQAADRLNMKLSDISIEGAVPVINGLVTTQAIDQAENKGFETAKVGLEMMNLTDNLLFDLFGDQIAEFIEEEMELEEDVIEAAPPKNGKKLTRST